MKEFNKLRKVDCLYCGETYFAKAKGGCCSKECKRNRKKQLEKRYRKEPNNKTRIAKSIKKYAQNNKKKINAKAMANYHIKMKKGQICQFKECSELATEKHHEDYDKPLVVKFYCRTHHSFIHRRKNG